MMARLTQYNRECALTRRSDRRGFTLVEVLVVLAILIILFGLLFLPIIASLDMVTVGQARVTMQTSVRTVMEQMRREISNAMYIYPESGVILKGPDGVLGTWDDIRIPNPSQIVFVSPQRLNGALVEPLAAQTDAAGNIVATRFSVMLRDPTRPYDRANPFVLVREEGYYTRHEDEERVAWVFENRGGEQNPIRNVLSPQGTFDIPVSRSVCSTCGVVTRGYIETCPLECPDGEVMYVHDNVSFRPERIVGELLQPSANNTRYEAKRTSWAGLANPGNIELSNLIAESPTPLPSPLGASPFDPRIVLLNPAAGMVEVQDTFEGNPYSDTRVTWNSNRGVVQIGASTGRWIHVPTPNQYVQPGSYYDLAVRDSRPDVEPMGTVDYYSGAGLLTQGGSPVAVTARQWDIVPVYPTLGQWPQPGDPAMPIAYRIDTAGVGRTLPKSYAARVADRDSLAKVVPGSVRVVVWATDTLGRLYQTTYSETTTRDQTQIGREQFAVVMSDSGQRAEVLFNELRPPSPQMLTRAGIDVIHFGIYIQYYYRRNYDPSSPDTDYMVRADYSTREIMNLQFALQRHNELEPDPDNPAALIIPEDAVLDRVSLEDQTHVRNLGR